MPVGQHEATHGVGRMPSTMNAETHLAAAHRRVGQQEGGCGDHGADGPVNPKTARRPIGTR